MNDTSCLETSPESPTQLYRTSNDMIVVFRLEGEAFALPATAVAEIVDPVEVTKVPGAPRLAPGVLNVRGTVAPFLDIRFRLGMAVAEPTEEWRMIVLVGSETEGNTRRVILADAVEQVVEANLDNLDELPAMGASWPAEVIRGALRHDDELIFVLEPRELMRCADDAKVDADTQL